MVFSFLVYLPSHVCQPFFNPDSLTINQYLNLNTLNYSFKQLPHISVNKKHQKRWTKKERKLFEMLINNEENKHKEKR